MIRRFGQLFGQLTLLLAVAMLAGCASGSLNPTIDSPAAELPGEESSAAFLDRASEMSAISENDAFRGILLLTDGKDPAESFSQRVSVLLERKIVSDNWTFHGDRPITRGKLAYMIYQSIDMPGGLILKLTGPSQRYCLRELQYKGFFASETAYYGKVSGMEYLAVINRADEYIATGSVPSVLSTKQGR